MMLGASRWLSAIVVVDYLRITSRTAGVIAARFQGGSERSGIVADEAFNPLKEKLTSGDTSRCSHSALQEATAGAWSEIDRRRVRCALRRYRNRGRGRLSLLGHWRLLGQRRWCCLRLGFV